MLQQPQGLLPRCRQDERHSPDEPCLVIETKNGLAKARVRNTFDPGRAVCIIGREEVSFIALLHGFARRLKGFVQGSFGRRRQSLRGTRGCRRLQQRAHIEDLFHNRHGWNGYLEAAFTGFEEAVGDKTRKRFTHRGARNRHGLRERGVAKTLAHWKCTTTQLLSEGRVNLLGERRRPAHSLENQFAHKVSSEACPAGKACQVRRPSTEYSLRISRG